MSSSTPASEADPVPGWVEWYLRGATYQEVADHLGVSKQHVPNLLRDLGVSTRTAAETARLREVEHLAEHGEAMRARFLTCRDVRAVAAEFGVPVARARRLLESLVPDASVLARVPRQASKRYSRDDLLASLAEAAEDAGETLTAEKYRDYVDRLPFLSDGRPRPGGQVMGLRFGSWGSALQAAGLPSNPPAGPPKRFEDPAVAVVALAACWRDLAAPPTVSAYDDWQRGKVGRPSSATARKLLGSWDSGLIRAWQVVHGISLDQDDPEVAVPESLDGEGAALTEPDEGSYRPADEDAAVSPALGWSMDGYLLQERAVQAHARLQNAVAAELQASGIAPRSPLGNEPQFDVAFMAPDDVFTVVEVKSCTAENMELQLRLGLGQVLRYADQLRTTHGRVRAVLAAERAPSSDWIALLRTLEVGILREGTLRDDLDRLLRIGDAPAGADSR